MEIIKTTFTDKKAQANAVINSEVLNKLKGNELTVINYVLYKTETENEKTGEQETKKLLTFETAEHEYYGTVSANVMESWDFINETMGGVSLENPITLEVSSSKSKNDREFLQIAIV